MPDTRSFFTPSPPEVARIGQQLVEALKPMLDDAFDTVMALPGDPAERQNDALSLISTVAAFAGMQFAARLALCKGIEFSDALYAATHDVQRRMAEHVAELLERAGNDR